ncbi:hypothetical protein ACQEU1_35915, partial [Lentzea sp. CA-135723]
RLGRDRRRHARRADLAASPHEEVANALVASFITAIGRNLLTEIGAEQRELRATLCATQMVGLGMVRYVVHFEPLASTDLETVVKAIAPNMQRYLTGDLD